MSNQTFWLFLATIAIGFYVLPNVIARWLYRRATKKRTELEALIDATRERRLNPGAERFELDTACGCLWWDDGTWSSCTRHRGHFDTWETEVQR